jgi:cell division septal protein FtsQ
MGEETQTKVCATETMKEQVIASRAPRAARGAATQPKGLVQRPARRGNAPRARTRHFSPRTLFAYVPSALKAVLGILVLIFLFIGYRAAASAEFFQARNIDVSGTARVSKTDIEGLTRRAVSRTGVWRADLSAISAELGRLPGVRRAVVTRVLPDRLRVRVTERVPLAVVRNSTGHFFWVDEEGVALGELKPDDSVPAFFIRGWDEDGTETARSDNAERVKKYQEALREWSALGLAERIGEIDLIDVQHVRALLAGNDSQIELRLGGQDLGNRLKELLVELDRYKQSPEGASITSLDIQTGRIVIGHSAGSKTANTVAPEEPAKIIDPEAAPANSAKPVAAAKPDKQKAESTAPKTERKKTERKTARDTPNTPGIRLR